MAVGGDQRIGLTLEANLDPSGVLNGVKAMQNGLNGLKIDPKLMSGLTKEIEKVNTLINKYQSQLAKGVNTKTDAKNLAKTGSEIQNSLDRIVKGIQEVNNTSISLKVGDATKLKTLEDNLKNIKKQIQDTFQQKISTSGLSEAMTKFAAGTGRAKTVQNLVNKAEIALERQELEKFGSTLDEIKGKLSSYKGSTLVSIGKALGLNDLSSNDVKGAITKITDKIDELKTKATEAGDAVEGLRDKETAAAKAIDNFKPGAIERGKEAVNDLAAGAEKVPAAFNQIKQSADNAASGILDAKTQVEQLQQSTQYFFSLRNMINLLKRGIDEAVQSVKDLDKAMTETAVVTDYKVSDLWGMLPEYTKVANDLGATTQGAYETMTLYYQQGLNQQQAFELGAETMKMARIAGLDYAETTDMMTAALRGFNMELNEVSAKRVNDVYSKLAAVTASDTEELGTAMQRTASIAASAGASFEGTTAFLAQAIETTREPAENIGTAMKTIVARFQEMKKNPLEISEVDGEEVDYNKIDAALKTIGVDLKDTNGQFRNFDEVMLDISARWDSLSQAQQRYIATTAAGSRQQSRFIAMVSNYDRTMQLMEAANNSAGASDEQFGKTMDSLESKLNQLHNAWQAFTMGIANNGMIKLAVDGLTKFLTVTNKIINTLSMGSGAIKSFLSVFAAFTGLKAAGRLANRAIGGLGGLVDPTSTFKQGFKGGAIKQGQTGTAQAKAISDPIVTAVNRIYGAITGKQAATNQTTQNTTADFKTFKEANSEMRNFLGGIKANEKFSITDAYGKISNLDERQQKAVLQQLPGLQLSLQKNGIDFDTTGISKESQQLVQSFVNETNKGLKENAIDSQGIFQLFGTPNSFKKAMEARGPEYAKAASEVLFSQNEAYYDEAYKQTYQNLLASDDMSYLSEEELHQAAHREAQAATEAKVLEEYNKRIKGTASAGMQAANDIASVGQAAVMAGQGVAQLGMQLSNAGFEQAGQAVTNLGYQISSLGQIATSVGSIVGKISGAGGIGALAAAHPVITALIAAVTLLGGAFAIASAHFKNIKKAGEEVTNTFKETSKTAEDNISKLKAYQNELATLSKGVDKNGNNINLDDSQYQRYLEIVDDIAEINPDIVDGYNEQGHAIINNNKALAETIKKQEEIKKNAYDTYTESDSLQKLINARNINKGYKNIKITGQEVGAYYGYGHGTEGRLASNGIGNAVPLAGDVSSIADKLRLLQGTDALGNTIKVNNEMLQKYGIESLDALITGEEQAVKNFVKHRQQIEADLTNSGLELGESITKGFEKLGKDDKAFNEAIQPVYDNLLAQVSNTTAFKAIGQEFQPFLQSGLKDIASKDLGASDMIKEAKTLALRFEDLSSESSEYSEALEIVTEAQDTFAATLDETQYETDVQPAIEELERLKEAALDEGSVYGSALAEYLETQIQQIARFTEEGSVSITDALNTATDDIAAAEGALENFNDSTKSDYWTAAEGMKSIYDKATETFKDSFGSEWEKHFEGKGDQTAWKAGEALFGKDALEGISVDKLRQKFKEWEPALREGEEGWYNFWQKVTGDSQLMESLNAIDGVHWDEDDFYIPEDKWAEVARTIGISEDMLTSMLNKGRQFADISFTNWEDVRKAFATSGSAIEGISASGQKKLFVKESTFEQSLADANISRDEYGSYKRTAREEQGFDFLKPAEAYKQGSEVLAKKFNEMGVKTLPDLVNTLVKTGDFNREEIKGYAEKMDWLDSETYFDETYDSAVSALENSELAKQTSIQQQISDQLSLLVGKDIESAQQGEQNLKDFIHSDEIKNFAEGKNAEGKNLSTGEYEVTKKNIEEAATAARKRAEEELRFAELTSGTEQLQHKQLAQALEKDADALDEVGEKGVKAFKDIDKQAKLNAREKEGKVAKDKARQKEAGTYEPANVRQLRKEYEESHESKTVETTEKTTKTEETNKVENYTAKVDKFYEKTWKQYEEDKKEPEIDKEITYNAKTNGVDEANKDLDGIAAKTRIPYTVVVGGDAEEAEQETREAVNYALSQHPQIPTGADTSGAKASISSIYNGISTLFIPVKPDFQGNWTKTITIKKSNGSTRGLSMATQNEPGAVGKNNNAYFSAPILTRSAARGYGRLGPKGKGGPTLTGELGYEIAWLPSENRSMILGADGPQMIDLPGDAVVWTHEQSKKILKQKAIPAGSHSATAKGGYNAGASKYAYTSVAQTYYTKPPKASNSGQKAQQQADNAHVKAVKQMDYWWEKISRQVKTAERIGDRLGDKTTKILNDIRASVGDVSKINKTFVKAQKDSIALNRAIIKNSNRKLASLKKGSKNKNKDNWQTVEWQTKSGKKSQDHSQKMNLSNFIGVDANGTYYVDEKKINKKTSKGRTRSKAEKLAISEKTYELIDKWQDRRNDAQEAVDKAKDAIADYRKQIDDTFFGWKNELTEIYKITGQIEIIEGRINKQRSEYNLAETKLNKENLSFGLTQEAINSLKDMRIANTGIRKKLGQELTTTIDKRKETQNQQKELGIRTSKKTGAMGLNKDSQITYYDLEDNAVKTARKARKDARKDYKKAQKTGTKKQKQKAAERLEQANESYQAALSQSTVTTTERRRYKQLKKIGSKGSGKGWDELSTQEKELFARGRAFEKGYIKRDKNNKTIIDAQKLKKDKDAGKISEELYNLIKETYDTMHQNEVDILDLKTQETDLQQEQLNAEQEYKDVTNQLAEQLYGWKNTLTQILQLTYQIEQSEKRTSFLKSAQDYYKAKQDSGNKVNPTDILSSFTGQMISTVNQIQQRTDLVAKQRQDLQDYIKGTDISNQIKNLKSLPKAEQNDVTKARIEQLKEEQRIHDLAKNYVKTTNNADGTVSIKFDSKGLDNDIGKKFDAETASKIEEYAQELVDKNNELIETMSTNLSDITELYSTLADLKQQYADSAKELREAYGAQQQKIIDNLKTLYTAIDNNFKELISQVKQSIQQRRQEESNAKTEQDISKKQQRLAALRADTSGGNQVAIAQLQKEIADAQQSYGHTLEDQLIDKLSQQGDEAAKQRQKQIDLLQAQRTIAEKTGIDAELINKWIENPEQHKTEIREALQGTDWAALTQKEKEVFDTSLDNKLTTLNTLPAEMDIVQAAIGATEKPEKTVQEQINGATETAVKQASDSTLAYFDTIDEKLGKVTNYIDNEIATKDAAAKKAKEDKEAAAKKAKEDKERADATAAENATNAAKSKTTNKQSAKRPSLDGKAATTSEGAHKLNEVVQKAASIAKASTVPSNIPIGATPAHVSPFQPTKKEADMSYNELLAARASSTDSGYKNWNKLQKAGFTTLVQKKGGISDANEWAVLKDLANYKDSKGNGKFYGDWARLLKVYIDYKGTKAKAAAAIKTNFGKNLTNTRKQGWAAAFGKAYPKYKKGGIADYTGPAWLDGTPSKPELILNAKDTQNFLALRDVLDKALSSTNAVNNSYEGDISYEININVDKIEKDYDVDRVVEKVKKEIVKGAGYRNVTQVRNFR